MPLVDHLRELRRRLVVSVLFIVVGLIPAWIYYAEIVRFIRAPFDRVVESIPNAELYLPGVTDAFTLQLQIVTVSSLVLTSPLWLFQLWRFITPGLHKQEKRWVYLFVIVATPLALLGAATAYWTLPVSLELLIGFTPENVSNLIAIDKYFEFVFRMIAVFAVGFLSPMFVVLMNFADFLRASTIRGWWRSVIMIVMIFAAVATPTGDPLTMMLVALPILLLMVLAWAIAAVNDWRRRKAGTLVDEEDFDESE